MLSAPVFFYAIYIYNLVCGRVPELETGGQLLFWISWLQAVKTGFLITAVTAGHGARPRCAESVSAHRQKHTLNVITSNFHHSDEEK